MVLHGAGCGPMTTDEFRILKSKVRYILFGAYWHIDSYCSEMMRVNNINYREIEDKFLVNAAYVSIRNQYIPRIDRKPYMIYASMPNRGLSIFEMILPKLLVTCPGLTLQIRSSWELYGIDDKFDDKELYRRLSQYENCVVSELLPYYKLVDVISNSLMVAYPSVRGETMCHIVGIASVTGTPIVSSRHSALIETSLNSPYLVDIEYGVGEYDARNTAYVDAFVDKVGELYYNMVAWEDESNRLLRDSGRLTIEKCANRIIDAISM
jgi:hypothetical protein